MNSARCMLLAGCLVLLVAGSQVSADDRPAACSPACPAGQDGKVPRRSGQVPVCKPCKPGSFKNATTFCCQECEGLLTFDAVDGLPNGCTPCPAGARGVFDRTTNTSSCWCKDGFQSTGLVTPTGVPGCVACIPGTFNPNRTQSASACLPCPADTVAPRNGSERCFPCSKALNGSVAVGATSCVCPAGLYVQAPPPRRGGRGGGRNRMLLDRDGEKPEGPKGPEGGDDLFKKGSQCVACNTTSDNSVPNVWPACCTAGTSWNGTACV